MRGDQRPPCVRRSVVWADPMALQNRVDPYGRIFACADRGLFMGNRGGALHNSQQEIVSQYTNRRWLTCLLKYKDVRRPVMAPGLYTELFFLDEAVAFSAGHRPCVLCRRDRYNVFREAWVRAQLHSGPKPPLADEIDCVLQDARLDKSKQKVTHQAPIQSLPDGAFLQMDGSSYLAWGDHLYRWTPGGYDSKHRKPTGQNATILTPEPFIRCFEKGYRPEIHPSFNAL